MQPSVLMAVEQAAVAQAVVLVPVGAPGLEQGYPAVRAVMLVMVVLAEAQPAERELVLAPGVSAAPVKGKPVTLYSKP